MPYRRTGRRPGRPPYPGLLTPAEQRVLDGVRRGLANQQIAGELGLSVATVKTHVAAMLSKLYLEDRHQLADWQPEAEPAPARRWWLVAVRSPVEALRRVVSMPPAPGLALAGLVVATTLALVLIVEGRDDADTPAAISAVPSPTPSAVSTPLPTATPAPTLPPTPAPPSPTPTPPTPPPSPTPTPTPTATPGAGIPPRPASLDEYGSTIAAYLATGAGFDDCLAGLVAAWKLVTLQLGLCATGDFDADGVRDLALFAVDPERVDDAAGRLFLFRRTAGGFHSVELAPVVAARVPSAPGENADAGILGAHDINGVAGDELVARSTQCGAHTCGTDLLVFGFDGRVFGALVEPPPSMTYADIALVPNGSRSDLVLHGGTIASVGAGPQRARTERWSWGAPTRRFALVSTVFDSSPYRFFKVVDADGAFTEAVEHPASAADPILRATDLYELALTSADLADWHEGSADGAKNDHAYLDAYILFKLARLAEIEGRGVRADNLLARASKTEGVPFFAEAAKTYVATRNCADVTAFIEAHPDEFRRAWEFGYANPPPEPAAVCGGAEAGT